MRFLPETLLIAGVTLAPCSRSPLLAQAQPTASLSFVGCESSGQIEKLAAPKGTRKSVHVSPEDAVALAYYSSGDGIGLVGPRGWYCEGASGSGGSVLFLSPKPVHRTESGWDGLDGPTIAFNHISSENSGRYEVAEVLARVFPAYRSFAMRVLKDFDLPFPSGPYPKDSLTFRGKTIVEFNTPARTEGLGNFHSWLGKNDLPIQGAAIVVGTDAADSPDVVLLSVRFPPALVRLIPVIVGQAERDLVDIVRK